MRKEFYNLNCRLKGTTGRPYLIYSNNTHNPFIWGKRAITMHHAKHIHSYRIVALTLSFTPTKKYLGVPLISTRLSHIDCQPLLDKIIARTQSWTSRSLSFAGRLQLISSVLYCDTPKPEGHVDLR